MSLPIYAVYGSSGFGREVLPLLREQLSRIDVPQSRIFFVDDYTDRTHINGIKVISYQDFVDTEAENHYAVIAIADGKVRRKLALQCEKYGVLPFNVTASNAVILDDVSVEDGSILCGFSTLTSNIKIGKYFHANIYSYVAHDCIIGDFVTFAPGVKCNGNVVIGDDAYIGTGAVLKQGTPENPLTIGNGAVIGMGAVVTKNVAAGAVVVGNPARPLVKN